MRSALCDLVLKGELPHIVDGRHFAGRILLFSLAATPEDRIGAVGGGDRTRRVDVHLRVTDGLLATPGWTELTEPDLQGHFGAYVRDCVRRQGVPTVSPAVLLLDVTTEDGAYARGSPYNLAVLKDQPTFEADLPERPVQDAPKTGSGGA